MFGVTNAHNIVHEDLKEELEQAHKAFIVSLIEKSKSSTPLTLEEFYIIRGEISNIYMKNDFEKNKETKEEHLKSLVSAIMN